VNVKYFVVGGHKLIKKESTNIRYINIITITNPLLNNLLDVSPRH